MQCKQNQTENTQLCWNAVKNATTIAIKEEEIVALGGKNEISYKSLNI